MLRLEEKFFRNFTLVVILCCLVIYCFLYIDYVKDNLIYNLTLKIENGYFVNQPGCHVSSLDTMNKGIAGYMSYKPPINCTEITWFTTQMVGSNWTLQLLWNTTSLTRRYQLDSIDNITCQYWPVKRTSDWRNKKGEPVTFVLSLDPWKLGLPAGLEMLRVECQSRVEGKVLHQDVHFLVQPPPPPELTKVSDPLQKWGAESFSDADILLNEAEMQSVSEEPLVSVMILGIDTLSHLNFLRQMPLTAKYLRSRRNHVEFWGYNKVASNTYLNLVPMLSGISAEEFSAVCRAKEEKRAFDNCSFIWQRFKQAGYNTSYGEDCLSLSLFNYMAAGFRRPPTDHYLRPVLVECNNFSELPSVYSPFSCSGSRVFGDFVHEHIDRLVPHMQRHPFFSFYWWTQGVHNYFNYPQLLDQRFLKLFQRLDQAGITNNTFIIFMSDHGIRWGRYRHTYQGMLEDFQPLLFALYPDMLKRRYPRAFKNLQANAHSLLTTFDLYPTLLDLLELNELREERIMQRMNEMVKLEANLVPRSSSLFLPLSPWRNCNSSNIASSYCLCHKLTELSIDDSCVQRSARSLLHHINQLLLPYTQCFQLTLDRVLKAYRTAHDPSVDLIYFDGGANPYEIKLQMQTKPGGAQFEATTRITGYEYALVGEITRLGLYFNESYCIQHAPQVEMYCYCIFNAAKADANIVTVVT